MYIVKVGGGAAVNLAGVADDLASVDAPCVVVLGANAVRDDLAARLGASTRTLTSVSGYTSVFSDETALDVIMMAYSGLRSKRFVELCQRRGVNAVGLSGIDGRLVQGERNRGIRVREGGKTLIRRDFSGKPRSANAGLLRTLLDGGYTPVLTIPITDEKGCAINSENDDIVNVLQAALGAERIVQLIEAPGFLDDPADPGSVVAAMSKIELERREAQVEGRMKRKMLALRRLFETGAAEVIIGDGRVEHPIRAALSGAGTVIR
ncbi:MAG: [LysW]-aminoadipate kinase [Thiotrichales bacterium]|nr:[LysW]-aminoadipate kinase [Thiotrichales bacterium]MCY4349494.1 [LysW]-aminoadipate kinase [Thiotrichales bacterium]